MQEEINFCPQIECHVEKDHEDLRKVIPIILEHGFSSINVPHYRVKDTKSMLDQIISPEFKRPDIVAIADKHTELLSINARRYIIHSAIEDGANKIEIAPPSIQILEGDMKHLIRDFATVVETGEACKVDIAYTFDYTNVGIDEKILDIIKKNISYKKNFYIVCSVNKNTKTNIADMVLWARDVKKVFKTSVKAFVNISSFEDLCTVAKSGIDKIGIDWKCAPAMTHGYEEIIRQGGKVD